MTHSNIIRKSQTGEPGNTGEFGTHLRPAAEVSLTSQYDHFSVIANPAASLEDLERVQREALAAAEQLRGKPATFSSSGNPREHIELATASITAAGKIAKRESNGAVTEGEGKLLAAAEIGDWAWRYAISYWDRVAVTRDPRTSSRALGAILDRESEDDFMLAVAGHPNATAEQIDEASKHHASAVRMAALDNRGTALHTLVRIENEAMLDELSTREVLRSRGISPDTPWLTANIEAQAALSSYARSKIRERATA